VHHHWRLRLERRRCDASRRAGIRRVYACGEREGKEEGEKSGWMRFRRGGMRVVGVVGGRWVHWWIVLGGRKRGAGGGGEGRAGVGGGGLSRGERREFELGMVDWLGSLVVEFGEGVICV